MFVLILSQWNHIGKQLLLLRFNDNSFSVAILRFSTKWDYEPNFEYIVNIEKT